jgi:hypothetical protein
MGVFVKKKKKKKTPLLYYPLLFLWVLTDFSSYKVEYQEKQFVRGVIPSTYMRREGAPRERELLCGRLIDRPIRPLFPPGFYHEVQVCCYSFRWLRSILLDFSFVTFSLLLYIH